MWQPYRGSPSVSANRPTNSGPRFRGYLLHLLNDKRDSWTTIQVNRAALKFLYVRVLKQSWFDEEIPAPKKRPISITVLSQDQITRILNHTTI